MNILCNDEPITVTSAELEKAILELGYEAAHVATALNGEFVPRSEWARTTLKTGDQLDVVAPMQGG